MESAFCPADVLAALKEDASFRLIETFGHYPGQGAIRQNLHLARMAASARAFSIGFDRQRAELQIAALADHRTALRCRLTLAMDGSLALESAAMPPSPAQWRFAIAASTLRSDDVFLRHKTTCRELYDRVRQEMPRGLDELVFLNERGEICEGTITNLFVTLRSGRRVTPPLSSGVLPGVLRQDLLHRGQVVEQVVTLGDLRQAQAVTLGNSLRGEIPAAYQRSPDLLA
ncbi:aminotransferase class IV family protein [Pseudophaeobacter sp.]|jgi:4-amino-4-deoxychorismate lyase|uniref:aminotransferase class IV family protein n=1 Tax=Pseudophaeobacter sp. TaxID=1971739 RepID=UPI0025D9359F|nr:aminotransferase class IV family protein [uncultured Pseudophaeobacter sp.]